MDNKVLTVVTSIKVRFSEVDSMGIVWHGNYLKYMEDGREAFGSHYGINYLDFHKRGVMIPLVKIVCDYKRPLFYGDTVMVETRFINSDAAKIHYEYTLYRNNTEEISATGISVQVFVDQEKELLLEMPAFFKKWKKEMGLLT